MQNNGWGIGCAQIGGGQVDVNKEIFIYIFLGVGGGWGRGGDLNEVVELLR